MSISATFAVLIPVVPVLIERNGPHGAAGAGTAALFIGAVTGEVISPWLMSRWGSKYLLAVSQLATAALSLVFVLPQASSWLMLAATWVRGVGTGVAIVVSLVLVTDLAAPNRRGRSIGLFGLALSTPSIILPSIGVALLAAGRANAAALIALTAGLIGAGLSVRLTDRKPAGTRVAANMLLAIRQPGLLRVFAGFVLISCSFGGVLTYTPIALPSSGLGSAAAFLLVTGILRAASRWLAGPLADRVPPRSVMIGGIVLSIFGLVALALHSGALSTVIAAVFYGTGFGAVQTSSYLAMAERSNPVYGTTVSALWNSGIDLGSSLGGSLLGLSAARFGYVNAFWILPLAVMVSLPVALLTAQPVAVPTGELERLPQPLPRSI